MDVRNPLFNLDRLLIPYEQGGTQNSPVKRTIGTIATKLIISNKIPPEIVGAAIFKVFSEMVNNDLTFEGDGSFGSPGRELFCCIKAQAIDLTTKEKTQTVINEIYKKAVCANMECPMRTLMLSKKTRWESILAFLLKPRGFLWRI